MKIWVNYHHLLYFKTIAEEGSVSGAAEVLRLGQPTLSAQLRQLEDALGVKLFERHHKRLKLTEQGKIALDYARQIFGLGNEMCEVLADNLGPARINVQIGALDSIPKQVILKATQAAYKAGNCHVSLVEGKWDEILRELSAHRLDLAITNFIPISGEVRGLTHRSICKHSVGIYGAPKYKSLRKNFPDSVNGQRFVAPTFDSKLRYDLEHWIRLNGLSLDIIAETQDIGVTKLMAIDGMALMAAASHSVTRQVSTGELVEIGTVGGIVEELFLVSANRKLANPIAQALMKHLYI